MLYMKTYIIDVYNNFYLNITNTLPKVNKAANFFGFNIDNENTDYCLKYKQIYKEKNIKFVNNNVYLYIYTILN